MTDNTVVATYDGRNIEELIGFVEEEYPCVYCNVNGTLYGGTDGLAFVGKLFLFEKKMFLKWVDVKVQQTDHGVAIQTRADEPVIHEFGGLQKPERVWSALVSLHNQALLDRTRSPGPEDQSPRERSATAPPVHRRKQLRRNTSDPSKLTPAIEALFSEAEKQGALLDQMANNAPLTPTTPEATERRASLLLSPRASALLSPKAADEIKASINEFKASMNNIGVVEVSPESDIEAIVGKIQGEYPCFYNKQKGTLYTGSTALYFVGGRLFFPAKLTIQSTNIRQVQMIKGKPKSDLVEESPSSNEEVLKGQGIVIWTRDGTSHTFLGIESPDHVWASLVDLRKHVSTGPNSPPPFGMRRMNSDPNLNSFTGRELVTSDSRETSNEGVDQELAPPVRTEEELKEAWSQVLDPKNRFTTSVVKVRNCDSGFRWWAQRCKDRA
jgi:hypothetical protein